MSSHGADPWITLRCIQATFLRLGIGWVDGRPRWLSDGDEQGSTGRLEVSGPHFSRTAGRAGAFFAVDRIAERMRTPLILPIHPSPTEICARPVSVVYGQVSRASGHPSAGATITLPMIRP
jgi:hypothetical protein